MSFHKAMYEHLAGKSAITDLCSTRIYHGKADQAVPTLPRIVYHPLGGVPTHNMNGDSGLPSVVWQFDCVDDDPGGAMAMHEALRLSIDSFSGTMGTGDDAIRVRSSVLSGPIENETEQPGKAAGLFIAHSTCEFTLEETPATP